MSFKFLFNYFLILFVMIFSSQESLAIENIFLGKKQVSQKLPTDLALEEFIIQIRNEGTFTQSTIQLFETESSYCFNCVRNHINKLDNVQKGICEITLQSKTCQAIEDKKDLMDCANLKSTTEFNAFNLLAGCSIGLFNSVKDLLSFMWSFIKGTWDKTTHPKETLKETEEYLNSVKSYLITEYDRAHDQASVPFKNIKAAKRVAGIVAAKLYKAIEAYLAQEYDRYGCLNYQARTETICKVASDLIMPPVAAIALLKNGPKAVQATKNLKKFLKGKKDLPLSRGKFAEKSLKRKLNKKELNAIERAHAVGKNEKGRDGTAAGIGNYTQTQLRRKARILKDAGFKKDERRSLMEDGVVGAPNILNRIQSGPRHKNAYDEKIVLFDSTKNLPRVSSKNNELHKEYNEFRDQFNSGKITDEGKYISFMMEDGSRVPGRITKINKNKNQIKVTDADGKKWIIDGPELNAVRTSQKYRHLFPDSKPKKGYDKKIILAQSGSKNTDVKNYILPQKQDPTIKISTLKNQDVSAKVGNFFKDSSDRAFAVVEISVNGVKQKKVFYRSNSQALFRLLPAKHKNSRFIPMYDKGGMGEDALTAPPSLQAALNKKLGDTNLEKVPEVDVEDLKLVPVTNDVKEYMNYLDSKNHISEDGGVFSKKDFLNLENIPRTIEDKAGRFFAKPNEIKIKRKMQPDYSQAKSTYEVTSSVYGTVKAYVYKSKGDGLEYTLLRDKNNKIWFGDIGFKKGYVTEHGLRNEVIDSKELTMPLFEYKKQIPIGFRGKIIKGRYQSAWNYIREIPEIKRWYKEKGIPIPGKD